MRIPTALFDFGYAILLIIKGVAWVLLWPFRIIMRKKTPKM